MESGFRAGRPSLWRAVRPASGEDARHIEVERAMEQRLIAPSPAAQAPRAPRTRLARRALHVVTPRYLFTDSKARAAARACRGEVEVLLAAVMGVGWGTQEEAARAVKALRRMVLATSAAIGADPGDDAGAPGERRAAAARRWTDNSAMFREFARDELVQMPPADVDLVAAGLQDRDLALDTLPPVVRVHVKQLQAIVNDLVAVRLTGQLVAERFGPGAAGEMPATLLELERLLDAFSAEAIQRLRRHHPDPAHVALHALGVLAPRLPEALVNALLKRQSNTILIALCHPDASHLLRPIATQHLEARMHAEHKAIYPGFRDANIDHDVRFIQAELRHLARRPDTWRVGMSVFDRFFQGKSPAALAAHIQDAVRGLGAAQLEVLSSRLADTWGTYPHAGMLKTAIDARLAGLVEE